MCLCNVTGKAVTEKDIYAWKVYNFQDRIVKPEFRIESGFSIHPGMAEANEKILMSDEEELYLSGFHCFLNKKDAEWWASIGYKQIIGRVIIPKGAKVTYGNNVYFGYRDKPYYQIIADKVIIPKSMRLMTHRNKPYKFTVIKLGNKEEEK